MKKNIFLQLLALFVIINHTMAQNNSTRVPYTLFNDFETGEMFGWEPYPYAQDIGGSVVYRTQKSPTYNNSRYALSRPIQAHDAVELEHGFTKRLNFYTTAASRVKAAVYFQSDRNPEKVVLSLGTFDGRRYLHTIQNPIANQWVELDIPLNEFHLNGQALVSGEHIQVITIKSNYPVVNYLFYYTMLMDNFSINGERDIHFTSAEPVSTNFEMFDVSILNKHFYYGDNINLKTSLENNNVLSSVKGILIDSRGKVVKDNILFTGNGKTWENGSIYKLSETDARGQWGIKLIGRDDKGTEISQTFNFLVPGKKVVGHPRLFFSSDELQDRIKNEKSPVAKRILNLAIEHKDFMNVDIDAIKEGEDKTLNNLVGGPYSKYSVGFNAFSLWLNPISKLGGVIEEGSLNYSFTGDRAAGELAKKALLKLCSFTKWNNSWMLERKYWTYYPVGYTVKSVAYGYDMLYDLLTEKERAFVREAIMEKGLKLFHRDMVEMNRMPSNQTNHIAVLVAGFGLAATAIYGDDPANPYLEPYLSGILTKAKTFIDRTYYEDGSYGEPKTGYMQMATSDIIEILATFERNFGVDYSTTTNVQNFYKYPLQASSSKWRVQDYGDGGGPNGGTVQLGSLIHSQWFVHRTGNPILYNYVKPYWEAGNGGYLGYLWFRDDITPVSRVTLAPSKVFSAQGTVMRSGWDDASTIISTRVGPNSNHYHYDQGSFQIMTNDEVLLTDAGVGAGGYYANLEYRVYNTQAIAHNIMLVDHDAESQAPAHYDNGIAALRDWPRMVSSFTGKVTDAVESDLSSVYKGKLDKYNRTLIYTKSGPLFIFDQVKSKSPEGHVYDWLFHAPPNEGNQTSISYTDGRMTINRPKARLIMDVISPDIEASSIRDRGNGKILSESFLTLVSKPKLKEVNFLAVLLPEAISDLGKFETMPKTTKIESTGWIGARVERSGKVDFGFFRTADNAENNVSGFATDAKRFTALTDLEGTLINAYFDGKYFSNRSHSIKSDVPVACEITFSNLEVDLLIKSQLPTSLSVSLARQPEGVSLNGSRVRSWKYDAKSKMFIIKLPAGVNTIAIN